MTGPKSARLSAVLATLLACGLVAGLLVPAAVTAGDSASVLYFERSEIDADAGETVTLDLVASSQGDHFGNGVGGLSATLEYDADVFTVTDVEHGPMLADGDSDVAVDGSVDVDDDTGRVTITQERTPSGDGAKATDTAATITLEVSDDAPSTSETIEITDASLVSTSGSEVASFERDIDVSVESDDAVPRYVLALTAVGIGSLLVYFVRR